MSVLWLIRQPTYLTQTPQGYCQKEEENGRIAYPRDELKAPMKATWSSRTPQQWQKWIPSFIDASFSSNLHY